jgi:dTDP-4-amino-4,6-dideoxygalactose transaminase
MEPYRSQFPGAAVALPETERLTKRVLVMPTGTAVSSDDITRLCGIVAMIVRNGAEVRRKLEQRRASGAAE